MAASIELQIAKSVVTTGRVSKETRSHWFDLQRKSVVAVNCLIYSMRTRVAILPLRNVMNFLSRTANDLHVSKAQERRHRNLHPSIHIQVVDNERR